MRLRGRRRRDGKSLDSLFFLPAADGAQEPREEDPEAVADERNDGQQNEENYERSEIAHASQAVKATSRSNDACSVFTGATIVLNCGELYSSSP